MNAAQRLAAERGATETRKARKLPAEVRQSKQRRGFAADGEEKGKCGETAEELRNYGNATLLPTLHRPPKPRPARLGRAFPPGASVPAETGAKIGRAAPLPGPAVGSERHTITRRGRAWAVSDPAGELVALVLYRKGAAEVVRRLDMAGIGGREAVSFAERGPLEPASGNPSE